MSLRGPTYDPFADPVREGEWRESAGVAGRNARRIARGTAWLFRGKARFMLVIALALILAAGCNPAGWIFPDQSDSKTDREQVQQETQQRAESSPADLGAIAKTIRESMVRQAGGAR
ncbi:hypothetical protein [Gordonia tangerina]|uniref:Uncharacterized protein n=1 Tax=Gordonia tangerina TaxID=2911060 RepID=A0ABS9DGL5_9ACTN|nr:hypothetical protein [Gordonia tangerina]MCF3937186.1 hypothetical protein [Gordonia tangerina]